MARGPTWAPAAPRASETCSGWRPWTALAARAAAADLHPELGGHRALGSGSSVWNCSAMRSRSSPRRSAGSCPGSGRIEDAVGFDDRGQAMAVAAVVLALLAPGPGRLVLRFTLGERRRLALARPALLLQQLLQLGDASVPGGHRARPARPTSPPAQRSALPPPRCRFYHTAGSVVDAHSPRDRPAIQVPSSQC